MATRGRRKKWHGKRALLNGEGYQSTAAIVAEIEDSTGWESEPSYNPVPAVTLQFANCDRSIAYDLDWGDDDSLQNSLDKVDLMIDCLRRFRKGLVKEQERYRMRREKAGY